VNIIFRIAVCIWRQRFAFCKTTKGSKSAAAAAAAATQPDIQNIEIHARKVQVYDQQHTVRCGKAYYCMPSAQKSRKRGNSRSQQDREEVNFNKECCRQQQESVHTVHPYAETELLGVGTHTQGSTQQSEEGVPWNAETGAGVPWNAKHGQGPHPGLYPCLKLGGVSDTAHGVGASVW
jgi:hypothetical protein